MNRKLFSIAVASAIWLSSCQKDLDLFIPDPVQPSGPDTTWYNAVSNSSLPVIALKEKLKIAAHVDSFEITNNPVTLNTPTCQFIFPANSCVLGGRLVTGKVYIESMLITGRGDMVRMDKPTISANRMLVSGGEIFIRLRKENQELSLAPGKQVKIRFNDPAPNSRMRLFYGNESNPEQFDWIVATDSAQTGAGVFAGNQYYDVVSANLRWINCDYFYDTAGVNRVQVATSMAPNFTNGNSVTYLVFNNLRTVLPMYGNATLHRFMSAKVPVNQPVTVVVVSKQGDDYYLGHETTTTSTSVATSGIQSVAITPVKKTLDEVKQFLATL